MRNNFKRGWVASAMLIAAPAYAQAAGQTTADGVNTDQGGTDRVAAQQFEFAVPVGATKDVLVAIAETAGRAIDVRASALAGRRSGPVRGRMTLEQALQETLAGSGLVASQGADGTFRIANASAGGDIVVIGMAAIGAATTSTRSQLSVADNPQGVQVLGKDLLESRQAVRAEDVLRFSSGVTISPTNDGQDTVVIRGFQAPVLTGGFASANLNSAAANGLSTPAIAIESVNIVKGADSILAGDMDPGGIVDVVRKKPVAKTGLELDLQGGSYGEYIVSGDATGHVFNSDVLSYRLIGSSRYDVDSYFGFRELYQRYLAPSVAVRKGPLDLVVGYELNDQRQAPPVFTFINHQGVIPYSRTLGASTDYTATTQSNMYYEGILAITNNLRLHSKLQSSISKFHNAYNYVYAINTDTGSAIDEYAFDMYRGHQLSTDNDISWVIRSSEIKNTAMVGGATQSGTSVLFSDRVGLQTGLYTSFVFNPLAPQSTVGLPSVQAKSTSYQIYARDELTAWRFIAVGSIARANNVTTSVLSYPPLLIKLPGQIAGAWLPGFGLTFKVNTWLNLYSSYIKSFQPQSQTILASGTAAPPSQGKAMEAGVKATLAHGRALATLDVFKSQATNVVYYNTQNLATINPSGNTSKGVEFDLRGQVTHNFYLSASYTYTDVTQNSLSILAASYLSGVPKQTYALWGNYRVAHFGSSVILLAGGLTGRSDYKAADGANPAFRPLVPAQHSFDTSVTYDNSGWSLIGGVKNLADARLYADAATITQLGILPGRTFTLTASKKF